MAFKLMVVAAKQAFIPAPKKNKKTGQLIIDPETGKPKMGTVPGPYRITFNDDSFVSVTRGKIVVGQDEKNKDILESVYKFSVNMPGAPITDHFGRPTGQREPEKQIAAPMTWDVFVKNYGRCGMPELVLQGMEMADAENAAKRAA